jgi:hypothetical protein
MEEQKALIQKDDSLPFRIMDALDDELIIAELEGRMPEVLTYHFTDKGQEVWGLSKAGVDEATGELAKQGEVIREIELDFTDGENEAFFKVKAGRFVISKNGQEILLDTKFGTKRQSKKTVKGNDNSFWYEQGSIKACRNASMRLIPKTIVQAVIENAKQKGKVKEVKKEDNNQDMEILKKESETKYIELQERAMKIENKFELQKWWVKHVPEIKELMPEHLTMITELKNKLKAKFDKVKNA